MERGTGRGTGGICNLRSGRLGALLVLAGAHQWWCVLGAAGIRAEPGGYGTFDRLQEQGVYVQQNRAGSGRDSDLYLGKVWPRVAAFTDWKHPQAQEFWTDEIRRFHDDLSIDGRMLG